MGVARQILGRVSKKIHETITVDTNKKIQFRDTGIFIQSDADGKLLISSDGAGADDIHFTGNVTFTNDVVVNGDFTFGDVATDDLTINGDLIIADDQKLHFGTGEDVSLEFDENGTDDLRITTASALGVGLIAVLGSGTATGAGGAFDVTAGAGGATSGAGGAVTLTGGAATNGNSAGGAVTLTAGAGQGTSAGGAITGTSGAGEADAAAGTGGASGAVTLAAGAAGTGVTGTGGAGGAIAITGAAGGATSGAGGTGGAGSSVSITAGAGGADSEGASGTGGAGGSITLTAGAGGAGNTTGAAGTITLSSTNPVDMSTGGLRTKQSVANVTEAAPTDAELDSAFGTPATLGRGFIGTIDDNDADAASILCWTSDASWYHVVGVKSV